MNDRLRDAFVGKIRSVRERYEVADPWQTWADDVIAGVATAPMQAIEAAAAAGAVMAAAGAAAEGTEPPQHIARAANAIAHAFAVALVYGDGAAPEVELAFEIVEREIPSE